MKKIILLGALIFIFVLSACSDTSEIKTNDDEKIEPKVEDNSTKEEENVEEQEKNVVEEEVEEDIWTYYENATTEDVFEEMVFKIEKVVVSEEAPTTDENGEEVIKSAVGIKMTVENISSDKKYDTYPDQATLVTSTGEQVEADMWTSSDLGGEYYEGVIKQGDIFFFLDRGKANEITWIKLIWSSSYEDPNGNYENDIYHDHEVKIELK